MVAVFGALFNSFSEHRPAQREYAWTGLRSHARCHPYPIPQPVKVGHATGVYITPSFFRIVMWVVLRPIQSSSREILNFVSNKCNFKIGRSHRSSSIWNHKYDFRPKLHDIKFNYHYITAILASQINSVSANILLIGRRLVEVESETL